MFTLEANEKLNEILSDSNCSQYVRCAANAYKRSGSEQDKQALLREVDLALTLDVDTSPITLTKYYNFIEAYTA